MIYYRKTLFGRGPKLTAVQFSSLNISSRYNAPCHVHLIPRRKGDVENPKGGVRHAIPLKGNYEDKKS